MEEGVHCIRRKKALKLLFLQNRPTHDHLNFGNLDGLQNSLRVPHGNAGTPLEFGDPDFALHMALGEDDRPECV